MCKTLRSRMRSSSAICTSSAVLPTPARAATTPTLPRPRPPCIDFSKTRMGLRSFTSLRYMPVPSLSLLGLLFAVLLDELLGERRRQRSVARKLHGELGFPLGRGAEDGREAEHLREGHLGLDTGEAVALRRADDDAAALHEDANDPAL